MLEISGVVTAYGKIEALKGLAQREARAGDMLARPEWGGQDDTDDVDRRYPEASQRVDQPGRQRIARSKSGPNRKKRCRAGAGKPAGFSGNDSGG